MLSRAGSRITAPAAAACLPAADRAVIQSPGRSTTRPGGRVSLVEQFVRTAKSHEHKLAIVDRATGQRVTYRDALLRSLILSRAFRRYAPGMIGVMIPTSGGAIYSVIGALMSGRTPVMINYSTGAAQNCEMAQRRLAFRTIVTSRALLEKIKCPVVDGMVFIEDLAAAVSPLSKLNGFLHASMSADRICRYVHCGSGEDRAVILFTSGSEREPKAVPLTNGNVAANIRGMHQVLEFGPKDVILGNLPLFHVFGLTVTMWLPLTNAMAVVTHPNPLEFRAITTSVREEGVTMMVGTPTFLAGYLQKSDPGDFATVRLLITGADKCPESLRQGFLERHGQVLLEGYGTTETSPVISVNTPGYNRPGSVGKVLPNVDVRMEHYETGEPCGVNEIGKILVRGDSVMASYFDDFEATTQSHRQGWYDTGDMGYRDDEGYLWHVGRLGRFLKIGGEMVSLVQVEDVLQRQLPDTVECGVVEVPDAVKGAKIVAAVTAKIDEKAAAARAAEALPRIAVPRQFVVLPFLPKMPSGKVDYRALTELVRDAVRPKP
jgi:acyl-[acyl-carrier-protein]-phospholipid O-acyltransferase / long-chain-fatty-acid--[acyl-carrier-protein] ligase